MKYILLSLLSLGVFAQTAITPNMDLTKPLTGNTNYVSILNGDLDDIDSHDHTPGKGVQVPEGGIKNAAVSANKIATGAVTEDKIAAGAVTTTKIGALAVDTGNIAASAVTTAKIADLNVTTGKINDLAVTTGKIADGAVTAAKLAALNYQLSSDSGGFSTTSTSFTDVTNLSVTITTNGRPVILLLFGVAPQSNIYCQANGSTNLLGCSMQFLKAGVSLGQIDMNDLRATASATGGIYLPPSVFQYFDTPTAGTYTYKVQAKAGTNNTMAFNTVKLVAYEL